MDAAFASDSLSGKPSPRSTANPTPSAMASAVSTAASIASEKAFATVAFIAASMRSLVEGAGSAGPNLRGVPVAATAFASVADDTRASSSAAAAAAVAAFVDLARAASSISAKISCRGLASTSPRETLKYDPNFHTVARTRSISPVISPTPTEAAGCVTRAFRGTL